MAHKTLPMTGPKGTKLRYITKEEEKLLKERERSKGSITDKFYKGVPVLYTEAEDAAGRAAFGEAGGSSGADMMGAGDLVDALHGLGLYIFAGEDLPEPEALTSKEEDNLYDYAKPLGKDMVNDLKNKVSKMEINANNYEACMEKIEQMIQDKTKGEK